MSQDLAVQRDPALMHPGFSSLVQRIIESFDKPQLEELRREFHTRLRIAQAQPDDSEVVEDLWDFFYDWCVFEQRLPDGLQALGQEEQEAWGKLREGNVRSLYAVAKAADDGIKLKDMYSGRSYWLPKKTPTDFLGLTRGDHLEGRLLEDGEGAGRKAAYHFARKPSYHPAEVHPYIRKKVRELKGQHDFGTYQAWLWILVGMSIKHRMYRQMPIEKIYDDNSRI